MELRDALRDGADEARRLGCLRAAAALEDAADEIEG